MSNKGIELIAENWQSEENEWQVLAYMLITPIKQWSTVLEMSGIQPAHFTSDRRIIYKYFATQAKYPDIQALDIDSLMRETSIKEVFTIDTLSAKLLTGAHWSEALFKEQLNKLKAFGEKRRVIFELQKALDILKTDPSANITEAMEIVSGLHLHGFGTKRLDSENHIASLAERFLHQAANPDKARKVYKFGLQALDAVIQLHLGELMIIGAEPGVGKTAFIMDFLMRQARLGRPSLFCTLEMDGVSLAHRVLSLTGGLNHLRLSSFYMSEIEWRKLQFTQKRLQSIPLFVTAFNHINIQELRLTIKTYKALYGIEVVGIDYLQLLSSLNTNKGGGLKNYEILADMVEQLRQLALECNILIVLASQLTRYEGDDRPGKLRERDLAQLAGGVTAGQAAHVVLILQSLKIKNGFFPDLKRAPELICIQLLKNRGGPPSFKEGVGHHIQNGKGTVVVLNAAKMTIADLPSYINLNAAIDED